MAVNTYRKDYKTSLSANFKVNEFACKGKGCCSKTSVDSKLVEYLQKIRNHFGKPVTINSGYRCATHNKNVGGTSNSYHIKGMAADIVVEGVKPAEVAKYAESIGVLGLGLYDTFVHVDTRTSKSFWYGHGEEKRTTFGGVTKPTINNTVLNFQKAAIADGYTFPKYGADGSWGAECEAVAKKAICRKYTIGYKNKNLTRIIQARLGLSVDGKFGAQTKNSVIAFQKAHGLNPDGIVGLNTWKKILGV